MLEIIECPVCKSQSLKPFRSCTDFTVSHETFHVRLCTTCTLGITTPRPDTKLLGKYYQSDEYISHSGKAAGLMGPLYKLARTRALNWKTRLLSKYQKPGTALDFGCGTGEFLKALKTDGWKIAGIEPSAIARKKAEITTGEKIYSDLTNLTSEQYETITAWHVLEHVPDLNNTLQILKSRLKKDGTIFIAVPNYESPDAKHYKNYWAGYDVPRHLWHFSKNSMTQLLEQHKLKMTEIVPMKLDAYYVSMLSEKYVHQNEPSITALTKGFFSGLRSNITASTDNYSSLIYIAKHA